MNILCVGYRDWALSIYDKLSQSYQGGTIRILRSKEEYSDELVREYGPDLILFYGWSWIVSGDIIKDYKCVMLHPSKLPAYRGGSPLQNQIISGERISAVTLFLMTDELDAGPILFQEEMSLQGHLADIFSKMISLGYKGTMQILSTHNISGVEQVDDEATYCERRNEDQSEITLEELQSQSAEYLYNKIRMLEDPYPNAFIRTKDNKKLLIKFAEVV